MFGCIRAYLTVEIIVSSLRFRISGRVWLGREFFHSSEGAHKERRVAFLQEGEVCLVEGGQGGECLDELCAARLS